MLGGAADLLRPLLGLVPVVGGTVMTSSSAFFGKGFHLVFDIALLGGGGSVGGAPESCLLALVVEA